MKRAFSFLFLILCLSGDLWAMGKTPPKEKKTEPEPVVLSLSVWDCFDLALKRSEAIAIKKEEIARTLGNFLEASGEAIGDVDFQSTNFRQDPQKDSSSGSSVGTTLTATERRERKFIISQPLFQGFKALGALSGAGSLSPNV